MNLAQGIAKAFLAGTNCSVLAYGATGSGKTHTMLGSNFSEYLDLDANQMDKKSIKKSPNKNRVLKSLG